MQWEILRLKPAGWFWVGSWCRGVVRSLRRQVSVLHAAGLLAARRRSAAVLVLGNSKAMQQ